MAEALVESGSQYSDDDRRRAVIEYIAHGNLQKVSDHTNIPRRTLQDWRHTEWFSVLYNELVEEVSEELLSKNLTAASESMDKLIDRVKYGDIVVKEQVDKKTGEVKRTEVRHPVKARDLVMISAISQDKARVQLGKPTRIADTSESMKALADTFRQLARQNQERVVSDQ